MSNQVYIVNYNCEWAGQYEAEKEQILKLAGKAAVAVEHIGSTSVPGLAAKPVIDIGVAVHHLNEVDSLIEPLQSIGYEYVPKADFPARRFFRKGAWRKGTHHLHVYEIESMEWRNNLLFRNYLRNHPDKLRQYADLKRKLARLHADDRAVYTGLKAPFIQEVIRLAQNEDKERP